MGRAFVNRQVQIGLETTAGTPVSANRSLSSTSIDLGPRVEAKQYRAMGYKYNTASRIHKQWSEGPISGPLSYTELYYLLYSLIGAPTTTTPGGGTNSRQHVWTPAPQAADSFKTLTVEQGDATAAEQVAYAIVTALNIDWGLEDVTMGGTMIGRLPSSTTLTSSPTVVAQSPVSAREVDIYLDTTYGGIGGTKLDSAISARLNIGNKFNPRWVLNTSYTSFRDVVEVPVDLSFDFETEHNSASRTLFSDIANNNTKYIRVLSTGALIEGSIYNKIQVDIACRVVGAEQRDADGVWAYNYSAAPIYDSSLGAPFKITMVNALTAF